MPLLKAHPDNGLAGRGKEPRRRHRAQLRIAARTLLKPIPISWVAQKNKTKTNACSSPIVDFQVSPAQKIVPISSDRVVITYKKISQRLKANFSLTLRQSSWPNRWRPAIPAARREMFRSHRNRKLQKISFLRTKRKGKPSIPALSPPNGADGFDKYVD